MDSGQAVEWVGPTDEHLFYGHPGRVDGVDRLPFGSVSVTFVNGPSLHPPVRHLRPLDEAEYRRRGRRVVQLLHPLEDEPISPFVRPGQEWPEGREPVDP